MSEHSGDGKRSRSDDVDEPTAKRLRESASQEVGGTSVANLPADAAPPFSRLGLKPQAPELPKSLEVATGVKADLSSRKGFVGEPEVGIIAYLGDSSYTGIQGVIKQRFTDFLVNEISLAGEIVHVVDIGAPADPEAEPSEVPQPASVEASSNTVEDVSHVPTKLELEEHPNWPSSITPALQAHFSDETVVALHALLLEGKEPPRQQDSGWGSRINRPNPETSAEEMAMNMESTTSQGRDRGRGRSNNDSRGGRGHRNNAPWQPEDKREVLSQVISDKDARAAAHKAIRELFHGTFETAARDDPTEGQKVVIRWSHVRTGARQQRKQRSNLLPYIHFTLQKTNRETMDCLGHISRVLKVHNKDLSVCGTKDKRAVTVQRVSLKRGNMSLEHVWKAVNGVTAGRRTAEQAVEERGERGTRIGDLCYARKPLDLGMLKGNHFTITLRNVQASSNEAVDAAMASIRDRGFINFYGTVEAKGVADISGMQRFGTSTVPTHVTGLLLLQQKWGAAVDSILSLREGEHPDCTRARLAWLEDQDFVKALEIMPRRSVAERAIWEHWKKGNRVEDKLGAITGIPRNLRSMYVHAYQSYIWNLVVSARIKLSSTSALVGDLVYADGVAGDGEASQLDSANVQDDDDSDRKPQSAITRDVKQLTEDDVAEYSLSDVIMPLPGWHVEYPGGAMGKLYEDIMAADGLDPHKMRRDQREYSLPGSYRKMVHKPSNVTWEHIRYTDPDLPLAQSDEDRLLGLNKPAVDDPEGKFHALKISWSLGTSSYATMALREITRQETSSWHQTELTLEGEDRAHKGSGEQKSVNDQSMEVK